MATFDAAALCLPFTLPQADVRRTYLDSLLSVGRVATGQPEWEIAAGTATLGSEADMGVAGGLGSGSAQGNKTRAIPTSKYKTADSNAAEAVAPPVIRSLSTDAAGDSLVALLDPATLLADAMLLQRTPGYRRHLAAHLPELHAGLVDRRREEDDEIEQKVLGMGSVGAARAGGVGAGDAAPATASDDDAAADAPMLPWWLVGNVVSSIFDADEEENEDQGSSDGFETAAAGAGASGGAPAVPGGLASLVPDGGISMRPTGAGRVTAAPRTGPPSALAAAAAGLPRTAIGEGGGLTRGGLGAAGITAGSGGGGNAASFSAAGFGVDDIEADNAGDPFSGAPPDDSVYLAQLEAAMGSLPISASPAPATAAASAARPPAPLTAGTTASAGGGGPPKAPAGPADADLMEALLEEYASAPTPEEALAAAAAGGGLPAVAARADRAGAGVGSSATPLTLPAGIAPSSASGSALQRQWAVTQAMSEAELRAAEATFTPVRTWPFPLDAFQRQSVAIMEAEGPAAAIFVAAHTSAGKTLVAEYAMSLAIAHRSKAVYTSPIKALSNQKYHDLRAVYGGSDGKGVGIITGDVSINGDAPCVIMTTEILRSMLYRGDPMIQEIEWAIFDEIHYM